MTIEHRGSFMKAMTTYSRSTSGIVSIAALAVMLGACGGGAQSGSAAVQPGANVSQAPTMAAGNGIQGPDLSQLSQIVLGKINQDPMRMEMKVTAKLIEFNVTSAKTEVHEGMGADTVVECEGVVVFDGDVEWNWQATEPKKAGEPAKFQCQAEYLNQGNGWQLFGPMGIYPL
jgi:hypothetical protein